MLGFAMLGVCGCVIAMLGIRDYGSRYLSWLAVFVQTVLRLSQTVFRLSETLFWTMYRDVRLYHCLIGLSINFKTLV